MFQSSENLSLNDNKIFTLHPLTNKQKLKDEYFFFTYHMPWLRAIFII